MQKGIFTAGALDNLDHKPSSTTAQGSLHGTSISIIQQPTNENPGIYGTQCEFEMVETNANTFIARIKCHWSCCVHVSCLYICSAGPHKS